MANISAIQNLQNLGQFLPDGVAAALEPVLRFMPPRLKVADTLALYAAAAVHTIVALDATTGAMPLLLVAQSQGTACTVKLYAADDATVGTTDAIASVGVSGTSGEVSWCVFGGAGLERLCVTSGSGIGIAAPATDVGTGSVANDPNVWVLYDGA